MTASASNLGHLPPLLASVARLCWWELRPTPGGRPTKEPVHEDGRRLSTTDDLPLCRKWEAMRNVPRTKTSGIGLVLTGGIFTEFADRTKAQLLVLDLDSCRDPETGEIAPWAVEIIEKLGKPMTEISPSETGLHIFVLVRPEQLVGLRGKKVYVPHAPLGPDKRAQLQLFTVLGYVTLSLDWLPDCAQQLTSADLTWLIEKFDLHRGDDVDDADLPVGEGPEPTHEEILQRVLEHPRGKTLVEGRWRDVTPDKSPSEAFNWLVRIVIVAARGHLDAAVRFLLAGTAFGHGEIEGSQDPSKYTKQKWVRADVVRTAKKMRAEDPANWFRDESEHQEPAPEPEPAPDPKQEPPKQQPPKQEPPVHSSINNRAPWPDPMAKAAMRGLVGEFVRLVGPETEADPHALMLQFVVMAGNACGPSPHFMIGATRHQANLFTLVVGETARGRKGTSEAEAARVVVGAAGAAWKRRCVTGLSSGEGLIDKVRDAYKKVGKDGKEVNVPGESDKRLMVTEGEFARPLAQFAREGNTLSDVIRNMWDGRQLATMTRSNPTTATGTHISVIAHCTELELVTRLGETDLFNGLGNRFLFCCSRRARLLPHGGKVDPKALQALTEKVRCAIDNAHMTNEVQLSAAAHEFWEEIYPKVSVDRPGLYGGLTARAETQVRRLALIYCLLDQHTLLRPGIDVPIDYAPEITVEHLQAALAVWTYCDQSVDYLFNDKLGHPLADKLLVRLRQAGPAGLSKTELFDAAGKATKATALDAALDILRRAQLAAFELVNTTGRTKEVWRARRPNTPQGQEAT